MAMKLESGIQLSVDLEHWNAQRKFQTPGLLFQ